ncbi:Rap1a/Tai family immunity protein [Castellaniella sp. UC4442_H9]
MMRSQALAAIFISGLTLCGTVASATYIDGSQLKAWSDGNYRVEHGSKSWSDVHDEALLIGYISGVSDTVNGLFFCPPSNAKLGQLMGVVRKHLLANPESWNMSAGMLVIAALRQAFPCK